MIWTNENLEAVAGKWRDGISARKIGAEFGVTKNAVLGVIHRLRTNKTHGEIGNRDNAGRMTDGYKRPAVKASKAIRVKAKVTPYTSNHEREHAASLPPLGSSAVADRGCCGFISGDPWLACNRPATGSWCEAHKSIVYTRRVAS
jgi:hypothetical protein